MVQIAASPIILKKREESSSDLFLSLFLLLMKGPVSSVQIIIQTMQEVSQDKQSQLTLIIPHWVFQPATKGSLI